MNKPNNLAEAADLQKFREAYQQTRDAIAAERQLPGSSWYGPPVTQMIVEGLANLRSTPWLRRIEPDVPTRVAIDRMLALQRRRHYFSPEVERTPEERREEAREAWEAEQEMFFLRMFTDIVAEDWQLQKRLNKASRKKARKEFSDAVEQLQTTVIRLKCDHGLQRHLEKLGRGSLSASLQSALHDLQGVRAIVDDYDRQHDSTGRASTSRIQRMRSGTDDKVRLAFDGREIIRDIVHCCQRSFGVCDVRILRLLVDYRHSSAADYDSKVLKEQLAAALAAEDEMPATLAHHQFDVAAVEPKDWRVALCFLNRHWSP